MIKLKITFPKPNLKWYNSSKSELLKAVEEHNKKSWAAEQDPVTGKRWAARVPPTGSWPLLKKSGRMQNSTKFSAKANPMDFRAKTNVRYGGFHQTGTSKMAQRRWLGLGGNFADKFASVVAKNLFKGKYTFSTH